MVAAGSSRSEDRQGLLRLRHKQMTQVPKDITDQVVDFELSSEARGVSAPRRGSTLQKHLSPLERPSEMLASGAFPTKLSSRSRGRSGLLQSDRPCPWSTAASDLGNLAGCLMLEEINAACPSAGVTDLRAQLAVLLAARASGAPRTRSSRYFPKLITGEWLGAYCLSEAGSGSDAAGLRCEATRDGDRIHPQWAKALDHHRVPGCGCVHRLCPNQPRASRSGISAFLVEAGLRRASALARRSASSGSRPSPTTEILLENVRIPAANLLGEEGQGFTDGSRHPGRRADSALPRQALGHRPSLS